VLRWHGGLFVCVFLFVWLFVCSGFLRKFEAKQKQFKEKRASQNKRTSNTTNNQIEKKEIIFLRSLLMQLRTAVMTAMLVMMQLRTAVMAMRVMMLRVSARARG
jgi:hypothetical protein